MPKVKKDKEAMQKRGDILFNLRRKRNVKQSTVADILGISQQAYLKYEHGDADPTIDALIILSDFYNVSIECLLGLEKIKEPDVLTRLAQEFNLTELEKVIVQAYIAISPKEREKFVKTIEEIVKQGESTQQQTVPPITQSQSPIQQQPVQPSPQRQIQQPTQQPYSYPQREIPPQQSVSTEQPPQSQIQIDPKKPWRLTARRTDGRYESRLATPEELEKLRLALEDSENGPKPEY